VKLLKESFNAVKRIVEVRQEPGCARENSARESSDQSGKQPERNIADEAGKTGDNGI